MQEQCRKGLVHAWTVQWAFEAIAGNVVRSSEGGCVTGPEPGSAAPGASSAGAAAVGPDGGPTASSSLRSRSLVSAVWMFAREGGGIAIRLVGVLLLTRLLGPSDFGVYAGALALVTALATVSQLNSEIFLLRRPQAPSAGEVGTVYTLLLGAGGAVIALALVGCLLADRLGMPAEYVGPFRLMLLGLMLNVLWAPAQAALERSFRYQAVGMLELAGDVVLYVVALPLALQGLGPYAPAWGYVAWQAFLLVGATLLSGIWPRPRWQRGTAGEVLRFAGSYYPVSLLPRLSEVVNPVVVGALAGPAGVGYVALAGRLVQTVGFVGRTAYRIALVVLAQISDDVPRLSRAFRQGLGLQALGVGVPTAGLCVASPWLVPLAFGDEWGPALLVLPWIAVSSFLVNLFALHSHVVTVTGRLRVLGQTYFGLFLVQLVASLVLVPAFGIEGYGMAGVVALVALVPLHRGVKAVFPPRYDEAMPWLVGLVPITFFPIVDGVWRALVWLPLVVVLAMPGPRAQLVRHGTEVWATLRKRGAQPA